MNPIVSAALVGALTVTSALSTHAGNEHADVIMDRTIKEYQLPPQHGEWVNHWMPAATGKPSRTAPSADRRMDAIIASYTREALDRGGWVNTVLTNSRYASGNPLWAVRVGEGVTWRASLDSAQSVRSDGSYSIGRLSVGDHR